MAVADNHQTWVARPSPGQTPPLPPDRDASGVTSIQQSLVDTCVRSGSITPIIGEECGLLGRPESPAWRKIGLQIQGLLLEGGLKPEERSYLQSLADEQKVPRHTTYVAPVTDDADLRALRLTLVRLGSKVGKAFGAAMEKSVAPVTDVAGYRVNITTPGAINEIVELAIRACVASNRLIRRQQPEAGASESQPILNGLGIYRGLIALTAGMCQKALAPSVRLSLEHTLADAASLEAVCSDLDVPPIGATGPQGSRARPFELFLPQLEWLADLLWYTFRCEEEAYPTHDELAFQVAIEIRGLADSEGPHQAGQRPDLVSVTQPIRNQLADLLPQWFDRYSRVTATDDDVMSLFYNALARILRRQYEATLITMPSATRRSARRAKRPVAFTTNFDLEMEQALYRVLHGNPFYIAIPVIATTRELIMREGTEPSRHLLWLLGKVEGDQDGDMMRGIRNPEWEWFPMEDIYHPSALDGPLIVKLHGSPLHTLPKPERFNVGEWPGEFSTYEHSIILSELDYLRALVLLDIVPSYFDIVLGQEDRSLFFLGLSLNEWNIRLRIHDQVYPGRDTNERAGRRMYAINRDFDPYRSSLLDALGVVRMRGRVGAIVPP